MSKWRFGCGSVLSIYVNRGFSFNEIEVECGSTSFDGGVNQCNACAEKFPVSAPHEDESDMDWYERQEG